MPELEKLTARDSRSAPEERTEVAVSQRSERRQHFGLVYEQHAPESVAVSGLLPRSGARVQRRDNPGAGIWKVIKFDAFRKRAIIVPETGGGAPEEVSARDLLVVKRFGEPIYPSLQSVGSVLQGGERPTHAVINGENFHALQLFLFQFEGCVDCIYIDPPYNTGARDWKYNNRYVDKEDSWRHSKWLSFMEKRLTLAKRLLKPDGVIIVMIDEHEVHHLGMLLERIFPEYLRYMVTIIINPKGTGKINFARVDEYGFFVVPNNGKELIAGRPAKTKPNPGQQTLPLEDDAGEDDDEDVEADDDDDNQDAEEEEVESVKDDGEFEWEYRHLRRRGNESSYRLQRKNQFYPIYIDEKKKKVVRCGPPVSVDDLEVDAVPSPNLRRSPGLRTIWPIDREGRHRCWRYNSERMQKEIEAGRIVLGQYNKKFDSWTLNIRLRRSTTKKLKTVWTDRDYPNGNPYDAGTHGTELLKRILGKPKLFPFPKSVYAVKDCLAAVVRDRKDALILDFFAGSGTTFHATCLLNSEDGGQRRSILVTNNEVADKTARKLNKENIFIGDAKFEEHGIFEQATRPRCEAIVKGRRPDKTVIPGNHLDSSGAAHGRPFGDGFKENIEFFKLVYLDPDEVDLGRAFEAILPTLWLSSGGKGKRVVPSGNADFSMPADCPYAILFKESRYRQFKEALKKRPEITHLWLVTDSEEAFAEMRADLVRSGLLSSRRVSMLYRDYLRNFQINTLRNL